MKNKIIEYENEFSHYPDLMPVKNVIPQWYKDTKLRTETKPAFGSQSMKACMPFLDSLTTGYVLCLAGDLIVSKDKDNNTILTWGLTELANIRSSNGNELLPIPNGCSSEHFFWHVVTSIKLPKGYSALFTHPLNRHDLPFISLSGIVDDFPMSPGRFPFFIKENFEGVIPQGTPFMQIIPFKRETWISKKVKGLFEQGLITKYKSSSVVGGWYKKNVWSKKEYN